MKTTTTVSRETNSQRIARATAVAQITEARLASGGWTVERADRTLNIIIDGNTYQMTIHAGPIR